MKTRLKNTMILTALLMLTGFQLSAQRLGKQTVAMMAESPAASKIITFINTVNAGEKVSDELVNSIFSRALIEKAGAGQLKNMMTRDIPENDGKLAVYVVDRIERLKFYVYAKGSKSDEWVKMDFTFDASDNYKIKGVGVDIIDAAPEGAGEPMKIG